MKLLLLAVSILISYVTADYNCMCSYVAANAVTSSTSANAQTIGYLYNLDCKPIARNHENQINFIARQFKKQIGYVANDTKIQLHVCAGEPSSFDRIPPTSTTETTTTNLITTKAKIELSTTQLATKQLAFTTAPVTLPPSRSTITTATSTTTTTPVTLPPTQSTTETTTITTTTATKNMTIQMPVTWPQGTYGLMEAASGCPASHTRWGEGWRKQDTEDGHGSNEFTPLINHYLKGNFSSNDLTIHFCMKHDLQTSSYHDQPWPKGNYCVLKYATCPKGFQSGYIFFDDEDIMNGNQKGGYLPDGEFGPNTKIYYCCRNDGSPQTEINLPTDRPFVLIRYGTVCQTVYGMLLHEVHIRYDDEDTFNKDTRGGAHPYDDDGSNNHRLFYCHYEPHAIGGPGMIG